MLGLAARHAGAPDFKAAGLQIASHQADDFAFGQPGIAFDFVERYIVGPRKGDDFTC